MSKGYHHKSSRAFLDHSYPVVLLAVQVNRRVHYRAVMMASQLPSPISSRNFRLR